MSLVWNQAHFFAFWNGIMKSFIRISLFPKLEKIGKQIFENERNKLLIRLEITELLANPFRLGNQDFGLKKVGEANKIME